MKNLIFYYVDPDIDDELNGLVENSRRMPRVYPGWELVTVVPEDATPFKCEEVKRISHHMEVHSKTHPIQVASLVAFAHASVHTPNHRFLIRSPYCRIGNREAAAVKQWTESKAQFHVVRDDMEMHNTPLVPHLWGSYQARVSQLTRKLVQWLDQFFKGNRTEFVDPTTLAELALEEVVWPQAKHWGVMRHDVAPRSFEAGNPLPFPPYEPDGEEPCGVVYVGEEPKEEEDATEERKESGDDKPEHCGAAEVRETGGPSGSHRDEQGREEPKEKEEKVLIEDELPDTRMHDAGSTSGKSAVS